MAAVVSKGILARKALDQVDMLLATDERWWPAVYSRAMNHLHWPRALNHSADAARDFRKCIELQSEKPPSQRPSYYVRAHIGLGDALAKDGDFAGAKQAWTRGLAGFPSDPDLLQRVALETPLDLTQASLE
jgi:hypothetical protein